jgi:hypothetical protein
VLTDVAAELAALESEPSGRTISLDHVWVHGAGRAIVLGVPASLARPDAPAFSAAEWRPLLRHLTQFMLEGHADDVDTPPRVPLPGHARAFIDDLWGAHLRSPITRLETDVTSLAVTRAQLNALPRQASGLMRAARLAPLLAFAVLLLPLFVRIQFAGLAQQGLSRFALTYVVPGLLLAFAIRGGALFRVFGISVQTRRGDPAGHVRSLARACVAWSPLLILALGIALEVGSGTWKSFVAAALLVFVAAGVYAVIRPERGLPDLIAGTHLMPK